MRKQAGPAGMAFWKGRLPGQLPDPIVFPDTLAGDRLYPAESGPQGRRDWLAALDKIESVRPRSVVTGHKRPSNEDSPRIIEETRRYVRDFDRFVERSKTAQEAYDAMRALYPDRVNPGARWSSARALIH